MNNNIINAGDKVRCIAPTTTGPYIQPTDEIYTVQRTSGNKNQHLFLKEFPNQFVYAREFEKVPQTAEELLAELDQLEEAFDKQKKEIESKVNYLEATGNKEYNDTEFKVWCVLQEIKSMADDVQKAKAIASIIEN